MRWLKFRSIQIRWEEEGQLCFLALGLPPFTISDSIPSLSDHAGTHYLTSKWIHCGKTPQMQMNKGVENALPLKLMELFLFPSHCLWMEKLWILWINSTSTYSNFVKINLLSHCSNCYIEEIIYMTVITLLYLVACSWPISGNFPLYKTLNGLFKTWKVCVWYYLKHDS